MVWMKLKPLVEQQKPINPYYLELTAMLERSLNFSQTGNTKVLTKKMMDHFGLSLGMVHDGSPYLRSDICSFEASTDSISIFNQKWPTHPISNHPLISSTCSHILNYGKNHFEVQMLLFIIYFYNFLT